MNGEALRSNTSKRKEPVIDDLTPGFEQDFAWLTGMTLTGLTLKRKEHDWLLVIRAKARDGRGKVTFVQTGTPEECLSLFWWMVNQRAGVVWRDDLYESTGGRFPK